MKKEQCTELRYDPINHDWVIIAPTRKSKGSNFKKGYCPFCKIESQESPVLIYNNGKKVKDLKDWTTAVIPNKYPVFCSKIKKKKNKKDDIYIKMSSPGFHEIVVSREHNKNLPDLSIARIKEIFACYQDRINQLKKNSFVNCALIFHNYGKMAGASQEHPHSQIITLPLADKELSITLNNFKNYFKKNRKCLQCKVISMEKKSKKRIVCENNDFIAFCPFAPKFNYEVVIAPKKHKSRFEEITEKEKQSLAEIFKIITKKIKKGLNDPSYNFYLRTAPFDKNYDYFHWHFVLFPRTGMIAGFELGMNMEICSISPEDQAKFLRKQ